MKKKGRAPNSPALDYRLPDSLWLLSSRALESGRAEKALKPLKQREEPLWEPELM
jgi:hypothetical protein